MPPRDIRATVREIWHLALPPGTTLAGGGEGLNQPVEWVASLRAAFPLFGTLKKGYLAIARLEVARRLDSHLTPSYLLTELHRARASALIVDEGISAQDAALADELALPVLALPRGSDLHQVEREILRTLVDREGQLARREREAREHLAELLSRGGLQAVVDELARLTSAEVALKDGNQFLLAHASAPVPVGATSEKVFLIRVTGRSLGELVVRAEPAGRDELDAVYMRQGAEVCGIELVQRLARLEAEERLGADLVEELLDETLEEEKVVSRLLRLGYDLSSDRCHLVVALSPIGDGRVDGICHHAARGLEWFAQRDGASCVVTGYRGHSLLLLSFARHVSERRLRHWMQQAFSSASARRCDAGVSRFARDIAGLRTAVWQALDALALGRRIAGHKGPYYFEELGLYRLLAGLRNRDEVKRFHQETLGALIRYDDAHGTGLVHTLEVFFDQNANVSQASRALYVHRNTLNYRLQRIVEITGLDLNSPEVRLALQLALKAHRLSG